MSLHRPAVLLAAALVLGATAAPSVAFADGTTTPTTLTADELRQELSADQATTADAAKAGWSVAGTDSASGTSYPITAKYDGTAGAFSVAGLKMIEVEHVGTYASLKMLAGLGVRSALKAIAQPHAAYVFEPQKSLDLLAGDSATASLAPGGLLKRLTDPAATLTKATKTLADDGTATYAFTVTKDSDYNGDYTLTIGADGTLNGVDTSDASEKATMAYAYAPQHVVVPTPGTYITDKQLSEGISLSGMTGDLKAIARRTATAATKQAHHHAVTARSIRALAGPAARQYNRIYGVKTFTTRRIARGVRITAVNPFTHAKATWTVKASGKQAIARRG